MLRGRRTKRSKTVDLQFDIEMASREFEFTGSVLGTEGGDDTGDIDISVRHGEESLRVDVSGDASSLSGTIYLNGAVFATVSGDPDEPDFVSADGDTLRTVEVECSFR